MLPFELVMFSTFILTSLYFNYDDDTNTYENYNNDLVSVYSVNDITPKELDVLDKFGVVYK